MTFEYKGTSKLSHENNVVEQLGPLIKTNARNQLYAGSIVIEKVVADVLLSCCAGVASL